MKKIYTQPAIDIENVMVESGIAASPTSPTYGGNGEPGQEGGWNDGEL